MSEFDNYNDNDWESFQEKVDGVADDAKEDPFDRFEQYQRREDPVHEASQFLNRANQTAENMQAAAQSVRDAQGMPQPYLGQSAPATKEFRAHPLVMLGVGVAIGWILRKVLRG